MEITVGLLHFFNSTLSLYKTEGYCVGDQTCMTSRLETRPTNDKQAFGPHHVDEGVGWLMVSGDAVRLPAQALGLGGSRERRPRPKSRRPTTAYTSTVEVGPLEGRVQYFTDPAVEASGVNKGTLRPWVLRRTLQPSISEGVGGSKTPRTRKKLRRAQTNAKRPLPHSSSKMEPIGSCHPAVELEKLITNFLPVIPLTSPAQVVVDAENDKQVSKH